MYTPTKKTIITLITLLLIIASLLIAYPYFASGSFKAPKNMSQQLSPGAKTLIENAFSDINEDWVDYHVHAVGQGNPDKSFIHHKAQSPLHPLRYIRYLFFKKALKIKSLSTANQDFLDRLESLIDNFPQKGKALLFAMDKFYEKDGTANLDMTEFYISNDYLFDIIEEYPDTFIPAISVHPYRQDAITELKKWHQKGARYLKWIPNAMGINPDNPDLDPFYQTLKTLDMVLITHGGIEQAVLSEQFQHLGNPLLLRRALDHGVKVIIAHGASLGECQDLDNEQNYCQVDCFDLFIRLMDNPKYQENLFGDISAITQINRKPFVVTTLLSRPDLHKRLVNGSDYPIPAINMLINTDLFVHRNLLTKKEAKHLKEIYQYNPLLYDFVLKRTLKSPQTQQKFANYIFLKHPKLH